MSPNPLNSAAGWAFAGLLLLLAPVAASAQTFELVHEFEMSMRGPGRLFADVDGTIYGVADIGGPRGSGGGLFKRNPAGDVVVLHQFDRTGAWLPVNVIKASDGALYGTTVYGGANDRGTIFKWRDGLLTTLHEFSQTTDGAYPIGGLIEGADGALYGNLSSGGPTGYGTLYRWQNGELTVLHAFSAVTGTHPYSPLNRGSDNALYGTTAGGGSNARGTIFKWHNGQLTTLHSFTTIEDISGTQGVFPGSDGALYGLSRNGVFASYGVIYKWQNNTLTRLYTFSSGNGGAIGVIQGRDGALYGTAGYGANGYGSIFRWSDGKLQTLHAFASSDGATPASGVVQGADGALYATTYRGGLGDAGVLVRLDLDGDPFDVMHEFGNAQPRLPGGRLVVAPNGTLFGTTWNGGATDQGAVYRLEDRVLTSLHAFTGANGANPEAGLVAGPDGTLYGTTNYGGPDNAGTIFKWDAGVITTLHAFDGVTGGVVPSSGVIVGSDGALYGTTLYSDFRSYGPGTLYRWDASGLTTLHSFDGYFPYPSGRLFEGVEGALYGTTCNGGPDGAGTIFKWQHGVLTTLHGFSYADGSCPYGGVIQTRDGALYGTTNSGGPYDFGTLFKWDSTGLTTLHSFTHGIDGAFPYVPLVEHSDGAIYGVADHYDPPGWFGTIFRWNGELTTVHTFTQADGAYPSGLTEGLDGAIYGTTWEGGTGGAGVVFRLVFTAPTRLLVSGSGIYNGTATLRATLTSGAEGVAGKTIAFTVDDVAVGSATTDENGIAVLAGVPIAGEPAGTQTGAIGASFSGADSFKASSGIGDLTVTYLPDGACLDAQGRAILPPIRTDGTSVFKGGSTVTARFRVCDAAGESVGTPGVVSSFRLIATVAGTVVTDVNEPVDSRTPHDEFVWDASSQQWVFHLSSKGLMANATYVYLIELNDGSSIGFQFGIR